MSENSESPKKLEIPKKTKLLKIESSNESSSSDLPSNSSSSIIDSSSVPSTSTDNSSTFSGDLEEEYQKLDCQDEKMYSTECNKFLLKKELVEQNFLSENSEENSFLYPNLNDKEFNIKIAEKKEFNDTKYDGTIHDSIKDHADSLAKADFELQPHQAFVKNFMSFQTPYSSLLLYHGLGTGKCHAKGTPIIMADGQIKLIENIEEGDLLMGDDSQPRKVLSLARGIDKMYDIIPIKGDKYTVNHEHILCLRASGFPKIAHNNYKSNHNYNIQWIENNKFQSKTFSFNESNKIEKKFEADDFFKTILSNIKTNDNVIEIAVNEYLNLSNKIKSLLKGYKVPIDFPEKELPMDPYMIGYWLGDGTSRESAITSQDSTVLYYFAKNLPKYKVALIHRSDYIYGVTGSGRKNENAFLNTLQKLNMINNKHIPLIYKFNSKINRLKLLAGLLDSDGSLNKQGTVFEFTQKNEQLMDDVIYLVRSLGLSCYKAEKKTTWTYNGIKNHGTAFRIHISGIGIENIPTQIPRKRANSRQQIKDVLVTGITVKYVKEDEYYGFTLDGNCRYLMGDFTVTHNTCSAIGVCEEMRDYMKQTGIAKRIIIVASENVQDNFKLQLFDERKLKLIDGIWNIRACTGNKLLKEINPTNMKGMSKDKIISQIKNLINTYYIFLGYVQFANYIIKTMNYEEEVQKQYIKKKQEKKKPGAKTKIQMLKDVKIELNSRVIERLRAEFDNRLIVIDEVHNIRKTDDNENKKVAINLELLVKAAQNMRFMFLSATPMYNNYKEIVWLLNLMNTNDRRGRIEVRDIFDKNGKIKNEELLIRKATGYISFVRGENPYTFPYRVYPSEFAKENTFKKIDKSSIGYSYPSYQMNLKKIKYEDKKRILSLYLTKMNECENCGKCQYCAYKYIIYNLRNKKFSITTKTGIVREMPDFENMESFGYTLLQTPLESLIISYPIPGLKELLDDMPQEKLSADFSESFSELNSEEEEKKKEEEEPSSIKNSEEEEEESEPKTQFQPKEKEKPNQKPLIIENSSEDSTKGGTKDMIDPHELTGKRGLDRMMNFVDNKSPPVKGDFEYKKTTIDHYGKIFSHELIGNYSIKIKAILDNIVNPETGHVSEGVILIYSQYIDSGLIPMALALEEMGFTRYGDHGAKPLFKHAPTEVVDVRTMKPLTNKKDFKPARYAMITGETRLSPNNDFEVKGLTDENKETGNIEGNKVKIVLISKAGSEGIDLKFIRQVHILEPWYNMNRIEQIIGRAVRNFSHKDLPFEKRNVEIFMYGTILGDNTEEAADLYVYRVAEYKAIQIGEVTRILKETAVDCIINDGQTNFTQTKMNKSLKEEITQELSSGIKLTNFKIGDAPFSPACDYMAKCDYDCRPNKEIDEDNLNEDTYNENFIVMNSEKILQRIRMLMKESFFYKKDVLIKYIRMPKEYPYVQIFSALTQLIEDENEFITDKYGRNGRLVNIGEYYLFQPIELRDKNASIFDRSVPIDYKHDMIKFEINPNITKPGKKIEVKEKEALKKEKEVLKADQKTSKADQKTSKAEVKDIKNAFPEGKKLVDEMTTNFEISREFTKQQKVPRGDDNWYKHCGIVMRKMSKEYPDSKEYMINYLVTHMLETLLFEDKLEVMNYLYSLDNIIQGTFEWFAKEYFDMNSITSKNFTAFIMYKLNKRMIMILNEDNVWVEAEPEDQREIAASKEAKEYLNFNLENYNRIIGFIGYEKSNRYLVFKTKDMTSKRDTGARCDEAGKSKTLQKLNEIIGEQKYTSENTKMQKDGDGNIISEAVGQVELCVLQEFILRYFNTIKKDNKQWILTPEMAIYHKLYNIVV